MPSNSPQYQTFADGHCDVKIPVNGYTEEFEFAQFLRLYFVNTKGQGVSDPRQWPLLLGKIRAAASGKKTKRQGDVDTGAYLLDLLRGGAQNQPSKTDEKPLEMRVDNLNELLATGTGKVGDSPYKIKMNTGLVESLMAGMAQDAEAVSPEGETKMVRIVPPAAAPEESVRPAVSRWQIRNLASFLAYPSVPGVDGAPFKVTLKPEEVAELREKGVLKTSAGEQEMTYYAIKAPKNDSGEGGGVGQGSTLDRRDYEDLGDDDGDVPPTNGTGGFTGTGGATTGGATTGGAATGGGTSSGTGQTSGPVKEITPEPESTPTGFHVALILPWKQVWTLLGYSRGRLLHSLTLAPGEETVIEVFSWDRRKRTLEQSSSTDTEMSSEETRSSKDSLDVYQEMVNSGEFYREGALNLVGQYGKSDDTHVTLGVNGKLTGKDNVSRTARTTANRLQENVAKASTRVKVSRTSKVTESVEAGREERVTRKVRNPNACSTLSLDYFELLSNYTVDTVFVQKNAQLVAMVPNPYRLLTFSRETVRIHEMALRRALLDDNLAAGFDAAKLLSAREYAVKFADEKPPVDTSANTTTANTTGGTRTPVEPEEWKAVVEILSQLKSAVQSLASSSIDPYLAAYDDGDGRADTPSPAQFASAKRWLYVQLMGRYLPNLLSGVNRFVRGGTITPEAARDLSASLPGMEAPYRPGTLGQVTDQDKEKTVNSKVMEYHDRALEYEWFIDRMKTDGIFVPDDAGLTGLLDSFSSAYRSYRDAKASSGVPPDAQQSAAAQQNQAVRDQYDALRFAFPLRDLADASEREDALLKHLAAHGDYYRYSLFQSLPPADQLGKLTGGALGALPPGIFQPRVISWLGDHLAVPLNVDVDAELKEFMNELISDVASHTEGLTQTVSLPTSGMSVDSRRGVCNACDDHTQQLRALELRRREQELAQATLETKRLEERLGAKMFDDPQVPSEPLRIRLDSPQPPQP